MSTHFVLLIFISLARFVCQQKTCGMRLRLKRPNHWVSDDKRKVLQCAFLSNAGQKDEEWKVIMSFTQPKSILHCLHVCLKYGIAGSETAYGLACKEVSHNKWGMVPPPYLFGTVFLRIFLSSPLACCAMGVALTVRKNLHAPYPTLAKPP